MSTYVKTEALITGHSTGYMSKEANPFLKTILKAPAFLKSIAKSPVKSTAAGAVGGAAFTPVEEQIIEKTTDSDLRPGARLALLYGNVARGAVVANPKLRKAMFGRKTTSFTDPITKIKHVASAPRSYKIPAMAGAGLGVPGVAAYGMHKVFPYDSKEEYEVGKDKMSDWMSRVINDAPGEMAEGGLRALKRVSPGAERILNADNPAEVATESAVKGLTNIIPGLKRLSQDPDPVGTVSSAIGSEVKDKLSGMLKGMGKQFIPDMGKSMGTSLGLGIAGSAAGWLLGGATGDLMFKDQENLSYRKRRDREKKRLAMKILVSTIGSAAAMGAAGMHQGDFSNALQNIKSKISPKEKV